MLEEHLRPAYQARLVEPLARRIAGFQWCTPNLITLLGGFSGVLAAAFLYLGFPWVAIALLLLSGYLDSLDGTIARLQQASSDVGTVLDIISDRVVEFAFVYALFALAPAARGHVALLMLGSVLICVTSFLVVGIFEANVSNKGFHYSPGIMERAEAFSFFILMALLPGWFNVLGIIFSALVFLTAGLRVREFITFKNIES